MPGSFQNPFFRFPSVKKQPDAAHPARSEPRMESGLISGQSPYRQERKPNHRGIPLSRQTALN